MAAQKHGNCGVVAMLCLFIAQAGIAFSATPFKRHIVYYAQYTETVSNGKIVATHFCMTPAQTTLHRYTSISVEAFTCEIDNTDLKARLWHQALIFLLRTEGDKKINATTSANNSAILSDTIQTTHELYILSPALESHITLNQKKRQANGIFTIHFGLPHHAEE